MTPLPPRDQRYLWLRYEGLKYTDADSIVFEGSLVRIYDRQVHRVQALDFDTLTEEMRGALADRLRMEHTDAHGQVVFTSHAWRWLFETRGPLVQELILKFFTIFRIAEGSYTSIRDPLMRSCHRLIAFSIVGRSQAPEKVTSTDLFYLKSINVGSVNIPYLLAQYLRRYASRRKRGARMSSGQFVARLVEHFGLLTEERLQGLTVVVRDLLMIDIDQIVRLWIWGLKEDDQAVSAPADAAQAPLAAAPAPRTMSLRMARLEEEIHVLHESLREQRIVLDVMSQNFSRFTTWTVGRLS
ncbi:hypothetical protein Tco_0891846 [Tanacetum coccineum]|uniref:Uncharacterized protein n=1 Tax=Tanacetum coccineum TaxID=301880 RepID=A0ABQ5CA72_9ASTR